MIDVLLLGTGAMMPLPNRYLSATLFRVGSSLHLVDCGEGTQVAMRQYHWGFKALDTILITHFHADHVAGLPGLMHTLAHSGKTEPLHIVGPTGMYQVVEGLFVIVGGLPFEVYVHELGGGDTLDLPSGVRVTATKGQHRVPVLAYRFDLDRSPAFLPEKAQALDIPRSVWSLLQRGETVTVGDRDFVPADVLSEPRKGVSLGITTDTRPTTVVGAAMAGVDLLIAEGTYGADSDADKAEQRGHMTFREAATLAHEAGAGALWLTHFSVGLINPEEYAGNATEVFADTTLGESGLTGTIAFETGYRRLSSG